MKETDQFLPDRGSGEYQPKLTINMPDDFSASSAFYDYILQQGNSLYIVPYARATHPS